jgi:hypothetical protein
VCHHVSSGLYRLGSCIFGVGFPAEARQLFGKASRPFSGAHPASRSVGIGGFFLVLKRPEPEAGYFTIYSTTPFIRINWDESSGYTENPDNWIFL